MHYIACTTPEGHEYYYNTETDETSWEKPEELMTEEEKDANGDWHWVPDTKEVAFSNLSLWHFLFLSGVCSWSVGEFARGNGHRRTGEKPGNARGENERIGAIKKIFFEAYRGRSCPFGSNECSFDPV